MALLVKVGGLGGMREEWNQVQKVVVVTEIKAGGIGFISCCRVSNSFRYTCFYKRVNVRALPLS